MEHTITIYLAETEEEKLQELVDLFKKYQQKTGRDTSNTEKYVFDMWVLYGVSSHLQENYNYFKTVLTNQLKKGDAA